MVYAHIERKSAMHRKTVIEVNWTNAGTRMARKQRPDISGCSGSRAGMREA